jgi:hypothetical protein
VTAIDRKLAEIAGRADAAASGPWVKDEMKFVVSDPPRISVEDFQAYEIASMIGPTDYARANADFIAHARTDVPALLRLVAVLREQLGVARLFVHRDWCFVNDCSNETPCRDYFDGIERSDAAALAALEGE